MSNYLHVPVCTKRICMWVEVSSKKKIHKNLKQTVVVVVVVIQKYYVFSQLQCHHTYKCMFVCMYTRTYYGLTRINIDFLNVGCYFLGGSYSCCCSCNCIFSPVLLLY